MTFDEALEDAIASVTRLMSVCAEYQDLETARIAQDAQRAFVKRRRPEQIRRMETPWAPSNT